MEKFIHTIWIGGKTMPQEYAQNVQNLQRLNPDWRLILWTEEEVKDLTLQNAAVFATEREPAGKADILRLEVLQQFGGIYSDVDIKWFKPIEALNLQEHFTCCLEGDFITNNAFLAAPKGNPLIAELIAAAPSRSHQQWLPARYGPGLLMEVLSHTTHPFSVLGKDHIATPSSYLRGVPVTALHTNGASYL